MRTFVPISFQSALAAGGIALMPFVSLQLSSPDVSGFLHYSDMEPTVWTSLLTLIMAFFSIIHVVMTLILAAQLIGWIGRKAFWPWLKKNREAHYTLFSPIASFAMSLNVMFGPVRFFAPEVYSVKSVLSISTLMWLILFVIALIIELKLIRRHFVEATPIGQYDFAWLIDSFAFGMLALAGSGIILSMESASFRSWMEVFTWIALTVSVLLLVGKLIILIYSQIVRDTSPPQASLLSMLIAIPIFCLTSIAFLKLMTSLGMTMAKGYLNIGNTILFSAFSIAILYFIFVVYGIRNAVVTYINDNTFMPNQWGVVCTFVGIHVLSVYVSALKVGIWPIFLQLLIFALAIMAYMAAFLRWLKQ